jgi:colanic acid/amylovoran biosynthesis glycosyltransferase
MKTDLIAQGIFEKEIIKITPAIDYELFSNAIENSFDNRLNIITISRLHWIKGLEYTLEALAKVKQNGISFHYTIIGEGKEKERLQFAVHQLGLLNEVTFTGKLSPEEVKTTLGKGNLYIQYSLQEGFCNAVLEAQAMGKICIASDADGLQENIIDGVTGFVVSKRNPLSLANKIIEVNSLNRNEKIALSNAAAKRVRAQFTLEKQMEQFIAFYDS